MNATMNGRARKSLAEQIDRLDTLLDGLAENLNDAIATAVQQAVKQVLVEVLTNPALQERLQAANEITEPIQATAVAGPNMTTRVVARCRQFGTWLKGCLMAACGFVQAATNALVHKCRRSCVRLTQRLTAVRTQVCGLLALTWFVLYGVRHLARAVLTATMAGAAVGVATYWLSPWVAAVASGASGFVATLAVHVVLWFRQTLVHWPMAGR